MSLRQIHAARRNIRFPRVSGDEPGGVTSVNSSKVFSPRERG